MELLRSPTVESGERFLETSLRDDRTVLIVGRCSVDYRGRAGSVLGEGERVVIVKPDGTLLVHQREKREPVNWNPPGCSARVTRDGERLQLVSTRSRPEEVLTVTFEDLMMVASFDLEDDEELQLVGTEEDLVRSVMERPDLIEEGFVPKEKNKSIKTGEIDLYGVDSEGRSVIIEFKRDRATSSAVWQLGRYLDEIGRKLDGGVRGIVAAPKITSGAKKILDDKGLEFVRVEEVPTRAGEGVVYDKGQRRIREFDGDRKGDGRG